MGLDDLAKGIISKSMKGLAVASMLTGSQANAQDEKKDNHKEPPQIERVIPLPEKYFKIDDFVAATEGTREERRKLAEELFAYVLQHGTRIYPDSEQIKEMIFPLTLAGEDVSVRVVILSGEQKEIRIVIFKDSNTPVVVVDSGLTGTPSGHQLPVDEKGVMRPQGFAIFGEHPLANRIYLGILRQLMSKF